MVHILRGEMRRTRATGGRVLRWPWVLCVQRLRAQQLFPLRSTTFRQLTEARSRSLSLLQSEDFAAAIPADAELPALTAVVSLCTHTTRSATWQILHRAQALAYSLARADAQQTQSSVDSCSSVPALSAGADRDPP